MCLSQTSVSLLTEREQDFPTVAAYKHLAPNGAKTTTPKTSSKTVVSRAVNRNHGDRLLVLIETRCELQNRHFAITQELLQDFLPRSLFPIERTINC